MLYRFFSFSPSESLKVSVPQLKFKPLVIKERDTTLIDVNYRDPFLGESYVPKATATIRKNNRTNKATKIEVPIVWPTIVYKGIVSDTKDKVKVFMLIINGKTCLMKKGTIEEEVFLKEGDRNAVYVKYKGNLNIILQQE